MVDVKTVSEKDKERGTDNTEGSFNYINPLLHQTAFLFQTNYNEIELFFIIVFLFLIK